MEDYIQIWKNKKEHSKKAIKKFVNKLQQHRGKHLDRFAASVHETVFQKIDCLDCAGCCTGLPPIVNKTDAQRIAKKLGLSLADFEQEYLTVDEDQDTVMKQTPCPFLLEDNKCTIYEFRPKACREYPHTDVNFSKNLTYHAKNALYCPATFHILEALKKGIPV
ncbi:YkgJ family cysteine cluster protein [Aureispira anguillae]|uniref:YkgJ family cysteine cluster protein n=1 Tax=Aureispira anguillae TaxID=2864201 RepID=A0A916DNF8_9BACT|nr:YkgJ family cysteine cluster protein [Aureispira anguillae]BDS09849.1 YkgJ family cysteine cluster protein [Aureispira anguillae]